FRVVRCDNCPIPPADDPAPAGLVRVATDRFFAVYEADVLPAPRPDAGVGPITVATEELASAFGSIIRQANADYRYRLVQVTGRVVERHLPMRAIVLETGTNQKFQVQ